MADRLSLACNSPIILIPIDIPARNTEIKLST
nr:MAG TPA: hypothetical protein [Caudoviricetes sp.]